jgi:hypothetical protein
MDSVEAIARRMWLTYSSRNPSWGGEDRWEQQPEHRRDDFLAMAWDIFQLGYPAIVSIDPAESMDGPANANGPSDNEGRTDDASGSN